MNLQMIGRGAAILIGAGTLFWVYRGFDAPIYLAIGAGIVVYTLVRLAFALLAPDAKPDTK